MKSSRLLSMFAAVALGACRDSASDVSAPAPRASLPHASYVAAQGERVMTNLANPRGLAFGPDGGLYVAEAGIGGSGPCFTGPFGGLLCYGESGGVSRLLDGVQERVADGMPSFAGPVNGRGAGPSGISFQGFGKAFVTIGLEDDPNKRAQAPQLAGLGQLVQLSPSALASGHMPKSGRSWEYVSDIAQYERDVNPDCGDFDSNPFGIMADAGGVIIADAGANAFIRHEANGDLSTFAVFSNNSTVAGPGCPARAKDFVPTTIARGPDGAYYIGHLGGFPVVVGSSSIYRMERGGTPEVFLTGFTFIVAIAFDESGNLYVLQNNPGSLIRVAPDGTRSTVVTGLERASGLAIGPDGGIYVSTIPGRNFREPGNVLRFTP